jgi:hypothetical protein
MTSSPSDKHSLQDEAQRRCGENSPKFKLQPDLRAPYVHKLWKLLIEGMQTIYNVDVRWVVVPATRD